MSYKLNDKVKNLEPYEPIMGTYDIRLDANESFFSLNDTMGEKIAESVKGVKLNRYPDSLCSEPCKAFAELYNLDVNNVAAGNGSDELISVITGSFLEKSDKILTFSPDFSMYGFYGYIFENECVVMDKKKDFHIDFEKALNVIEEKNIKAVIFSNPCNPTSVGEHKKEVLNFISKTKALVIVDEAYMDFWDEPVINQINNYSNLIVLKTCSKALSLAGIRLGFAVANKTIINALKAVKSPYNVNSLTQAVASTVLGEKEMIEAHTDAIIKQNKKLYAGLQSVKEQKTFILDIVKPNTNFVFMKCKDSGDIFDYLKSKGIVVRHMGDYLRICAGTDHENSGVIEALKEYK